MILNWSRLKYICLGILVTLLTVLQVDKSIHLGQQPVVAAVTVESNLNRSPTALVQEGKERYQLGQFTEAIALWQQAAEVFAKNSDFPNQAAVLSNLALAHQQLGQWQQGNESISQSLNLLKGKNGEMLAQALNIQGSLQLAQGETEQALTTWEQATNVYQKLGNQVGVNQSLLNQTQALRVLGLYARARKTLEQINQNLKDQPDSLLKVVSLLNLGDTLRVVGKLDTSVEILQQSQAIAQKLKSQPHISVASLSLGNTAAAQQQPEEAIKYYQQAIDTATSPNTKLQAQLNQLRLFADTKKAAEFQALLPQIQPQIENLPPSRTSIYARVNFVQSLQKAQQKRQIAAPILATAIQQAKSIGDLRAESYALGYLGELYEQNQQWNEAQKLTEQALILAQSSNAAEISYLWQWQLGRVSQATGKPEVAIDAYNQAVKTLANLRKDLVSGNADIQYSFQESIEPIYRELVGLLLEPQKTKKIKNATDINQKNLQKALDLIESLKVAELDNYFGEDCLINQTAKIDQVDKTAAIIYPIILRDRLEIIVSLSNQPLRHYTTNISAIELEKIIREMRSSLRPSLGQKQRQAIAQKAYNLIIQPIDADLANSGIKTLVFVLDGSMKNIPMAALYDGKQYLVEKYSLAQTPGLKLLAPKPIQQKQLKILIGGITESRQGFSALPGVEVEIQGIKSEIPTEVLFNETFTSKDFQRLMRGTPFPVVHLATHGEFSSNADNTFILTWDNRLNVKELGELLQIRDEDSNTPIELLVLSACQTATGDKRAPLGLAGVAVRSGARSTIASLWSVDDNSTSQFMIEFYNQLANSQVTKAEAIRNAQLAILKQPQFQNPYYWAPFILVGNWL
ncbi:CHAT domain-containing protein [Anabaena sp. UHCC 0204]|uniref:CHAT domain-containing protein n=1 Tax=Anabaena sp. UHCC 0204 TaxID=2590009 RepID=UPI0014463315|nr:CHAT domain-containing protein [Anabaena sp. UHCC 0204]MTJ06209.1 CHAT domain-containing protein [Anabaena sp. UHCC 0204]